MSEQGIGKSVLRREDARLLTGHGRYTDDVNAPGQAYCVFVRSPYAHADVTRIDASQALAMPGVLGVFTGRDLAAAGIRPIPTLIAERGGGIRNRDGSPFAEPVWPVLAIDRVRHVGDPVACVVAESPGAGDRCGRGGRRGLCRTRRRRQRPARARTGRPAAAC